VADRVPSNAGNRESMKQWCAQGTRAGAYCPSCGAERYGDARYCAGCGYQFANGDTSVATVQVRAAQPEGLTPAAPPPAGAQGRRAPPWLPIAGAAIVIVAAAVAAVLLLSGGETSSGYQQQVAAQVAKVTAADDALATELEALRPGGASAASLAAANAAASATHDAQVALDVLTAPSNRQSLHAETDAALASQDAYLAGVTAALRNPSEAAAGNLTPLASDARSHWAGLAVLITGAGGRIGGYDQLAAWARAKAASSKTTGGGTSGKPTQPSGGASTQADRALVAYIAGIEEVLAYASPGV
jgi:outer membrane murein-binding lipoprotein Lpp